MRKQLCQLKNCLVVLLWLGLSTPGLGQTKQTEDVGQVWLAYLNQTRFSNKWGAWTDLHMRTGEDMVKNFLQRG